MVELVDLLVLVWVGLVGVEAGWLFDVGLVFHEYVAGSVRCDFALILVFVLLDPP